MASYTLTDEEMVQLDDGQDWYQAGDDVRLEGYPPDEDATGISANPAFQLEVNEIIHDNWIHWDEMPDWLRAKF